MHLMTVSLGKNIVITLDRFSRVKEPYQVTIKHDDHRMVLDFEKDGKALLFINGIIEATLKEVEEKIL